MRHFTYLKSLAYVVVLFVCSGYNLHAQIDSQRDHKACGSDIHQVAKEHPDFLTSWKAFESEWKVYKDHIDPRSFTQTHSGKYIIPVVVHVLHIGGTENISATQIKSQITILNTDFKMANSGLSGLSGFQAFDSLVPYFNGADSTYIVHGGDTSAILNRFEFRLATLDPQGNCTDGIVRVYTDKSEYGDDPTRFKQLSYWDRSKYYNIWVVKTIVKQVSAGYVLGYAQFPFPYGGQFPLTSTDGVTLRSDVMGNIGTASSGTGATATHETGHWLGLFHIWGDDFCASDGIDDTPIHYGPDFNRNPTPPLGDPPTNSVIYDNYGIAATPYLPYTAECYYDTSTTDTTLNALNLVRRNDIGRMWMNFMDYTNDEYLWMFTEQQYQKMNMVMQTYSFRGNLSTPANILASGTDDAAQSNQCSANPIADFWSRDGSNYYLSKKLICAGGDLTYRDGTYNLSGPNSNPATLLYDFTGGTPSSSTATNPTIIYDTPGDYDAMLTSTNSAGANSKTRSSYVKVSSLTADETNIIYYEDFEYGTSLFEAGKWITIDEGVNPQNKWEQYNSAGYNSSKCMVMHNDDNVIYESDFLISASYDLTTIANDKLLFRYAGARKTTSPYYMQNDQLRVYTSTNCGETWIPRNIKVDGVTKPYLSGDTLYNAGLFTSGFVPSVPEHWKQAEVDLSTVGTVSNVRIMFEWTSAGPNGNDFYLDQVQIVDGNAIGLEDPAMIGHDFSVFPNPINTSSQIYINLAQSTDATVDVIDLTGRVVKQIYKGALSEGETYFTLQRTDFQASGAYMVRLQANGITLVKKVLVN